MYLRTNIILIPLLLAQFFSSVEGDSLETTDDAEFTKLIKEEKYVVALFCPSEQEERCEEYESELASAREDLIDVMEGDGWVVKLVDSKEIEKFVVGKTDKPVVVMFRSGLPVIYNGRFGSVLNASGNVRSPPRSGQRGGDAGGAGQDEGARDERIDRQYLRAPDAGRHWGHYWRLAGHVLHSRL